MQLMPWESRGLLKFSMRYSYLVLCLKYDNQQSLSLHFKNYVDCNLKKYKPMNFLSAWKKFLHLNFKNYTAFFFFWRLDVYSHQLWLSIHLKVKTQWLLFLFSLKIMNSFDFLPFRVDGYPFLIVPLFFRWNPLLIGRCTLKNFVQLRSAHIN